MSHVLFCDHAVFCFVLITSFQISRSLAWAGPGLGLGWPADVKEAENIKLPRSKYVLGKVVLAIFLDGQIGSPWWPKISFQSLQPLD